jgi:hypothetical protein
MSYPQIILIDNYGLFIHRITAYSDEILRISLLHPLGRVWSHRTK